MKLIKDVAEIYCNKYIRGVYSIRIARHYIDAFGQQVIQYKIWDEFSTKEIAEREFNLPSTIQSMRNCGYNV